MPPHDSWESVVKLGGETIKANEKIVDAYEQTSDAEGTEQFQ